MKDTNNTLKIDSLNHWFGEGETRRHVLQSISMEGREKLNQIRPKSIGQASRISGVSPSDINVLLIYIGR